MEEKLAKVRAEIERVKKNQEGVFTEYTDGKFDLCEYLLHFIDSMQEEAKYKVGDTLINSDGDKRTIIEIGGDYYKFDDCSILHFKVQDNWKLVEEHKSFDDAIQEGDDVRYNEDLGCRVNLSQLKRVAKKGTTGKLKECIDNITEESLTKARKQLQEEPKECIYSKDNYTDEDRKVLCDGCEEECEFNKKEDSASEDLEQEVYEHLWKGRMGTDVSKPIYFSYDELLEVARHFVAWQKQKDAEAINENALLYNARLEGIEIGKAEMKQQLMANAVDGVVHHFEKCKVASVHYNDPTEVPMAYFTSPEGLSEGDKVKIIVIKEDEK